jgi:molybdopterin/thiamine biosynthesis adenylyltransferase
MGESKNQRVLIVGVGGLGVPSAMALVRGGIRELALIDPDPIELSNLPRQILYRDADIGTLKVIAAARRLGAYAPGLNVETYAARLDGSNATQLIGRVAFVIDATDDPATKFLINDVCVAGGTPFVYGGAIMMTGQAMTVIPGRTACLRCLFEGTPDDLDAESCRDAGIVGPVVGTIGEAQAAEALSWIRKEKPALAGRMLTYDGKTGSVRITEITARSGCGCGAAEERVAAAARRRCSIISNA